MRIILFCIIFVSFLDCAFTGSIADTLTTSPNTITPTGVITKSPMAIIASIIAYAIGLASILGVMGITWGGITMVLSVGEDEKRKKGKFMLIYSLVGVVIAGLAYTIVNIIGNLKL